MGCEHTMLTYTRAMDSALCVPLMVDAAIFCDHLAARGATAEQAGRPEPNADPLTPNLALTTTLTPTTEQAGRALAYLFKLNEGAATGVDPGFFHQSEQLASTLAGGKRSVQASAAA